MRLEATINQRTSGTVRFRSHWNELHASIWISRVTRTLRLEHTLGPTQERPAERAIPAKTEIHSLNFPEVSVAGSPSEEPCGC